MHKDGKSAGVWYLKSTSKRLVFCMYLKRTTELVQVVANWSLNEDHERIGIPNEDATRAMV